MQKQYRIKYQAYNAFGAYCLIAFKKACTNYSPFLKSLICLFIYKIFIKCQYFSGTIWDTGHQTQNDSPFLGEEELWEKEEAKRENDVTQELASGCPHRKLCQINYSIETVLLEAGGQAICNLCLLSQRMRSWLSREALLLVKSNSPSNGQLCFVSYL